MNRIMVFVTLWTFVNVFLAFLLRDSFHYVARLMMNRAEGDYHLFHHSAYFSFNISDVTQFPCSVILRYHINN